MSSTKKYPFYRPRTRCGIVVTCLVTLTLLSSALSSMAQNGTLANSRPAMGAVVSFPYAGTIRAKSTNEIKASNWLIGCETLDRDFADYDQYKSYLAPLGIKKLRMQAGWAKTEKVKGEYDFAWMDHIIDDATGRGLQPWLQTSYGNPIYPGGGGTNLGAGIPKSQEALLAWDKWVKALVTRYRNKVSDWEIWNEPNFADNNINSPEDVADLNIRTATIIKSIQPEAKISGLSMGHISLWYAEAFFKRLHNKGKLNLFDNITYHDYFYNPDANNYKVALLRKLLDKYSTTIKLRQGENGCPSASGAGRGALSDYDWSELTQAKWDVRRMLANLGNDMECSIFGIIEMAYSGDGPIKRLNYKGIIQSDSTKKVIRPKMAYYAIQHVASIFDNSLERIKDLEETFDGSFQRKTVPLFTKNTDRSMALYGYQDKVTKQQLYTIWTDDYIPAESNKTKLMTFSFSNARFDQPVYVDIISGKVYDIPAAQFLRKGDITVFKDIPVYDAPVLIAEKSLIPITN